MASADVQLLSFWSSPYAMRAILALSAKNVPFTTLTQDLSNKSPLLLQSNPVYKKIPVLLHHGKPVCESTIIVQYVDEAFPSPDGKNLLPADPYDRALARFWADFIDKKLNDALFRLLKPTEDERNAALQECKDCLSLLEEALGTLAKEPPYFGGATVGYVDIIMGPFVAWQHTFETLGNCSLELEAYPRLSGWKKAFKESALGETLAAPEKVCEFIKAMRAARSQAKG